MSMRRAWPFVLVALLIPIYVVTLSTAARKRKALQQEEVVAFVLPTTLLKITSLEFKGLAADWYFLNALTYYGGTLKRDERPRVKDGEWRWLIGTLNASAELDPYFFDPYYLANSFTWDSHLVKEINTLLAKGS